MKWETKEPLADVFLIVMGTECFGEWEMLAKRKDYKKPPKGKSGKGFRKGWRWVDEEGFTVKHVEGWRPK